MARLVNYKAKDGNRYSTFDGETSYNSSENLTESNQIHILPQKKSKSKEKKSKIKVKHSKKGQKQEQTIEVPTPTPTSISTIMENHRNRIIQKQNETISTTSNGYITHGRRRHPNTKSKLSCCFGNKNFSAYCRCNWQRMNCFSAQCLCCWMISWSACRRKCTCCNDSDNETEDDIDATFERYKYEMRLKELSCETSETDIETIAVPIESVQLNFKRIEMPLKSNEGNNTNNNNHITTDENIINEQTSPKAKKNDGKKSRYRKYWNWNDSWRSNSDKFLETLEYDMDGEQSLKKNNNKQKQTDARFCSAKG